MKKVKLDKKKHRRVLGKAIAWVSKHLDKLDTITDVLRILSTDSSDEVVSFQLESTYTTQAGKTYKMSLPMSKVKDSSDVANTIASIIVASADDLGAKVEEVKEEKDSKETIEKEPVTSKKSIDKKSKA